MQNYCFISPLNLLVFNGQLIVGHFFNIFHHSTFDPHCVALITLSLTKLHSLDGLESIMLCHQQSELSFIEPLSPCDQDLLSEVASSEDLSSILTMLLFDETLSYELKQSVKAQLKQLKCIKTQ